MLSAEASSAICVQRLDDSRNSAIHTTYRISLRSSSLREPRYPLLRVVSWFLIDRKLVRGDRCFRLGFQVRKNRREAPTHLGVKRGPQPHPIGDPSRVEKGTPFRQATRPTLGRIGIGNVVTGLVRSIQ